MTEAKKLKRAVRARARKTGESYTAARRQVLKARRAPGSAAATTAAPVAPRSAAGAISDGAIRKKTGRGLDHWFSVLDAFDPKATRHTDRARFLHDEHGVPGWHAQGITVAYERARGLRVANQACDGSFQVSVSRALPVSVAEVVAALGDARRRAAWLAPADRALARALEVALSGEKPRRVKLKDALNASLRIPWDGSTVELRITGRPRGGATTVVADNKNLRQSSLVEVRRAQWKVALDALKAHLSGA